MKTLQECKEVIADQYGHKSWEIMEQLHKEKGILQWCISRMHEAAELYASQFKPTPGEGKSLFDLLEFNAIKAGYSSYREAQLNEKVEEILLKSVLEYGEMCAVKASRETWDRACEAQKPIERANIVSLMKDAFEAGKFLMEEHPDDDSYDEIYFDRVITGSFPETPNAEFKSE